MTNSRRSRIRSSSSISSSIRSIRSSSIRRTISIKIFRDRTNLQFQVRTSAGHALLLKSINGKNSNRNNKSELDNLLR